MKKALIFLTFLLVFSIGKAQILTPAKWHFDVSKKEVKVGETLDLVFYADIDPDWYVYSSDFSPDLGPQVTTVTLEPDASFQLVGNLKPIGAKKKHSDVFDGEYTYFTKKAEFRQTVKILKSNPVLKGKYEYQVCSEKDGKCIPGKGKFEFNDIKVLAFDVAKPEETTKTDPNPAVTQNTETKKDTILPENAQTNPAETPVTPKNTEKQSAENDTFLSILGFMAFAFGVGFASVFTPCVYPVMPMTVTFFLKQSSSRRQGITKALIYGLSIIFIFTLPGILLAIFKTGDTAANFLSTHWIPNAIFFTVFIIFGLSFLGLFEIVLPSSVVNNIDAQADKVGGFGGIFFMALTLVVVSFSCTVPFIGSLMGLATEGQFLKPVLGFASYGLAVALPFTILAFFPNLIQKLPKSGGWLNAVKVVFGFLELALSLKFLGKIDQVYRWGILDRDIYLAFWIVIFALMGFYLLGKIQMPHDNKLEKIPVPRMILSIFTFAFVVYLIPGLFGSPLKPLAGYLPPQTTIDDRNLYLQSSDNQTLAVSTSAINESIKYAEIFKFPHRLQGFFDLQQALSYAKKVNKPVFIDFTGHGCENCREMEARVWSDPEVLKRLRNDYVLVALYVDDRTQLPEKEWIKDKEGDFQKTIGNKNFTIEIERFGTNAQPSYFLLNTEGKILVPPKAHDLNIQNFINFLDEGKKQFQEGKTLDNQTALN